VGRWPNKFQEFTDFHGPAASGCKTDPCHWACWIRKLGRRERNTLDEEIPNPQSSCAGRAGSATSICPRPRKTPAVSLCAARSHPQTRAPWKWLAELRPAGSGSSLTALLLAPAARGAPSHTDTGKVRLPCPLSRPSASFIAQKPSRRNPAPPVPAVRCWPRLSATRRRATSGLPRAEALRPTLILGTRLLRPARGSGWSALLHRISSASSFY
jgi:hypothetical protein